MWLYNSFVFYTGEENTVILQQKTTKITKNYQKTK